MFKGESGAEEIYFHEDEGDGPCFDQTIVMLIISSEKKSPRSQYAHVH